MAIGGKRQLDWRERARGLIWPKAGYARTTQYGFKRLMRVRATPHAIAAGFAAGAFASFTPLMGFHFVLSAVLALMTRGSIIASAVGTAVGNPLTFPFIWAGTYKLGILLVGNGADPVDLEAQFQTGFLAMLRDGLIPILLPMAVGGVLLGAIAWLVAYFPIRRLVAAYQQRRATARDARQAERRAREAAQGEPQRVEAGQDTTSDTRQVA